MMKLNKIIHADVLEGLKQLPDESINCVVTSPPYWGLRDYGVSEQIGLEKTPEEYVEKMIQVFKEIKRVLRKDGAVWLNLGDSYNGSGSAGGDYNKGGLKENQPKYPGRKISNLKPKDLIGIPWRVALALQNDGWYLRQDIIWQKPNPMPESVTDRCTKSHEYIFLLTKSAKYYFDNEAIKEPSIDEESYSGRRPRNQGNMNLMDPQNYKFHGSVNQDGKLPSGQTYEKRNKRSVWTVPTQPYKEAHFAVFPEALIIPCINAGCPEKGIVLDPFIGSGTTALVALKLSRNFIGIELNPEYIEMAEKRIEPFLMQGVFF